MIIVKTMAVVVVVLMTMALLNLAFALMDAPSDVGFFVGALMFALVLLGGVKLLFYIFRDWMF